MDQDNATYGDFYRTRPIVSPQYIVPLVDRALNLILGDPPVLSSLIFDVNFISGDKSRADATIENALGIVKIKLIRIENIGREFKAVRMPDDDYSVMQIQAIMEHLIDSSVMLFNYENNAFAATIGIDQNLHRESKDGMERAGSEISRYKQVLALKVQEIYDEEPELFTSFAFNPNNLIDLGLDHLAAIEHQSD